MFNCPTCGYASPGSARFCRQCGATLPAEGEPLEASTRSYGRQEPTVATERSAPLPPSISDAVAGDTARYRQPLQAAPAAYAPPVSMASVANTASFKRKRRFLKWGGFVLALLISGGIGAAINQDSNDDRIYVSREDRTRLERLRTQDQIQRELTGSVTEQQQRIREELDRRLEAIGRAKEASERAVERGEAVTTDDKPLNLNAYEYPGATSGQYSRIPGRELLTQFTNEDFETVSRFYQEKLGKPFVQVGERDPKQVLFQSTGTPSITVLLRESRDRSRLPEIIILRSPFRFPTALLDQEKVKVEDSQKPAVEPKPKTAK